VSARRARDVGEEALPGLVDEIAELDAAAMAAAAAHLDLLTKPPGSLGRLEELAIWLAGVTGDPRAAIGDRVVIVAAADHGVAARSVSAYPPQVTAQMVRNFLAGGAAISALAAAARARVVVLDVGVGSPIRADRRASAELVTVRVAPGTRDMTLGPAMTMDEAYAAVEAGYQVTTDAIEAGARLVGVGEMGIGNTTAASAIVATMTGRPPTDVTGPGTGIDEAGYRRKVAAISRALEVNRPNSDDPIGVLARVGGLEIAALVGVIVGACAARVPVVLDGFITGAAALVAAVLSPNIAARLLAAHRSPEPGHRIVLERLALRPLLELDMRLGEGSGAALGMLLLDAAVRIRDGMATFESAGVSGRTDDGC
jgi:nicotinate-nucleotide--dimethylbenzimidazole phosphoribosyltransferase